MHEQDLEPQVQASQSASISAEHSLRSPAEASDAVVPAPLEGCASWNNEVDSDSHEFSKHVPVDLPRIFGTDQHLLIELCAGTAILSRTAQSLRVRTLAVDHDRKRAPWKGCVMLDLADPVQVKSLCELISSEKSKIIAVFAAPPSPPCGTASRARERPLRSFQRRGFKVPQPLRSDSDPDMLPGLSEKGRLKVELASQLYDQLSEIMLRSMSLGLTCVIENPGDSLYWLTSFFRRIEQTCSGAWTLFDNCCHGGDRPKRTALWCSKAGVLNHLALLCDNSHPHKPWIPRISGKTLKFVTSEEAALGVQPRGNKLKPLVAEFGHYVSSFSPARDKTLVDKFLSDLPKGAKVTSRRICE